MPPETTVPFPPPPRRSRLVRIGTFTAGSCRSKVYAPACGPSAYWTQDMEGAGRLFRARAADPGGGPAHGFVLLRRGRRPGSLEWSAHWWEGPVLHRTALLLPGDGSGPGRRPGAAQEIGRAEDLALMAREADAWRRLVLEADPPSPDAYIAECCA